MGKIPSTDEGRFRGDPASQIMSGTGKQTLAHCQRQEYGRGYRCQNAKEQL